MKTGALATGWRAHAGVLLAVLIACAAGPFFLPHPLAIDASLVHGAPSLSHWLGTDELGRDILARLLVGGRISLAAATGGAVISVVVGGAFGSWMGARGGWADRLGMRVVDGFTSVPKLPVMMILQGTGLGEGPAGEMLGPAASVFRIVLVVSLFGWVSSARIGRALALELKNQPFVLAARALGTPPSRVLSRHFLPNLLPALLLAATLEAGDVLLYESVLSFLGLGIQAPWPSWGALLSQGFSQLAQAPHLTVLPGLFSAAVVYSLHRLGDRLRERVDPTWMT